MKKAIFLDRDGVINFDPGTYTFEQDKFKVLPDVIEFLHKASSLGYLLIVITNQGGIAKGLYTIQDVEVLHQCFKQLCLEEKVEITDIFVSPHHDIICKSLDRKPEPLMIEKAMYLYNIEPKKSLMIGDKTSDVIAAESCGVRGIKIDKNSSLLSLLDLLD